MSCIISEAYINIFLYKRDQRLALAGRIPISMKIQPAEVRNWPTY